MLVLFDYIIRLHLIAQIEEAIYKLFSDVNVAVFTWNTM